MLYDFLMKLPLARLEQTFGQVDVPPTKLEPVDKKTLTFDAIFRYMRGAVYGGKPVFYGGNFLPRGRLSARLS